MSVMWECMLAQARVVVAAPEASSAASCLMYKRMVAQARVAVAAPEAAAAASCL